MQRRTNEWYQGLREASSEEDDEDVILELETTFSSPHDHSHLKKTKNTPSVVKWGAGASNKSPPPLRSSGGKGLLGTKSSPTPPVWTEVQLESGRESMSSKSSGSNSSNSELGGSVRDRTTSRSPQSVDTGGGPPSGSS